MIDVWHAGSPAGAHHEPGPEHADSDEPPFDDAFGTIARRRLPGLGDCVEHPLVRTDSVTRGDVWQVGRKGDLHSEPPPAGSKAVASAFGIVPTARRTGLVVGAVWLGGWPAAGRRGCMRCSLGTGTPEATAQEKGQSRLEQIDRNVAKTTDHEMASSTPDKKYRR